MTTLHTSSPSNLHSGLHQAIHTKHPGTSIEIKTNTPHHFLIRTYVKRESTTPSPHHLIDYLTDHHLTDHLTDHHRTDHLTTESSSEAAAAWRPLRRSADLTRIVIGK